MAQSSIRMAAPREYSWETTLSGAFSRVTNNISYLCQAVAVHSNNLKHRQDTASQLYG